jgi:hypothetical protein
MKGVPLLDDEPMKSLTIGHLWQRVVMDILYIPKMKDRYHLPVVARQYLSR